MARHTDSKSDLPGEKDRQFSHFTDEFHKAKRNVLFWAVATILLSAGADSGAVEAVPLVRGLRFDQGFLVGGALLITAFMAAGYVRAIGPMMLSNSDLLFARTLSKAVETAEAVDEELQRQKARVVNYRDEMTNRVDRAQSFHDSIRPLISLRSIAEDAESPDLLNVLKDKDQVEAMATGRILQIFSGARNTLTGISSRLRERDQQIFTAFTEFENEAKRFQPLEGLEEVEFEHRQTVERLRNFATGLEKSTLRWISIYDHGLVLLACAIALNVGAYRLNFPEADLFGNEVEVIHQSPGTQPPSAAGSIQS